MSVVHGAEAPDDPIALALEWLPSNDEADRPQITLSSLDADGAPNARTVLLTEAGRDGFFVHTDAASRKVAELEADPRVALTILWPGFTRQLVVRGRAERASEQELAAAYRARSPYLQQLAWQNSTAFARLPIDERRASWARFAADHEHGFEQPSGWTGFLVRPSRLLFWESTPDTASRRLEYTLDDGTWQHEHLAG